LSLSVSSVSLGGQSLGKQKDPSRNARGLHIGTVASVSRPLAATRTVP
jgi:hypothetical protein